MDNRTTRLVIIISLVSIGLYFLFAGLIKAKGFFAPLTIAILLSMLLLPVANKFESWGLSRGLSVLFSDLIILGFVIGMFFLLSVQVQKVVEDWPQIKEKMKPKIEQLQTYISKKTGISEQKQDKKIQENLPISRNSNQQETTSTNQKNGSSADSQSQKQPYQSSLDAGSKLFSFLQKFVNITGKGLLVLIYIFFFMFYRKKFKKSFLKMVPDHQRDKTEKIINQSSKVSQNYLFGRFILILILAVLYTIGFTIINLKYGIFIAFLAAVFSLLPYLGNVIGVFLALIFAALSNGAVSTIIGVVLIFTVVQFVESYILEPFVVGQKVDLNPVFTILAVVAGGAVWGIIGMVVAIPVLGIVKVLFDNIPNLQPVGYMLGEKDLDSGDNFFKKAERWFVEKLSKKS